MRISEALVLYHSQEFGDTAAIAEAVAKGLRNSGCEVDLFNTNEDRFDVTRFPQYDCVAFGSPDYYSYIAGGLKNSSGYYTPPDSIPLRHSGPNKGTLLS